MTTALEFLTGSASVVLVTLSLSGCASNVPGMPESSSELDFPVAAPILMPGSWWKYEVTTMGYPKTYLVTIRSEATCQDEHHCLQDVGVAEFDAYGPREETIHVLNMAHWELWDATYAPIHVPFPLTPGTYYPDWQNLGEAQFGSAAITEERWSTPEGSGDVVAIRYINHHDVRKAGGGAYEHSVTYDQYYWPEAQARVYWEWNESGENVSPKRISGTLLDFGLA